MVWFEYFRNCWSSGIFLNNHCKRESTQWSTFLGDSVLVMSEMSYSSRRTHWVPLQSIKKRKLQLPFIKTGKQTRKPSPGLTRLSFCCNIWMDTSGISLNNMKASNVSCCRTYFLSTFWTSLYQLSIFPMPQPLWELAMTVSIPWSDCCFQQVNTTCQQSSNHLKRLSLWHRATRYYELRLQYQWTRRQSPDFKSAATVWCCHDRWMVPEHFWIYARKN